MRAEGIICMALQIGTPPTKALSKRLPGLLAALAIKQTIRLA
jgi:hypothetical protein